MTSGLKGKIKKFIRKHPHMSPTLARFPVPATFWKAGAGRVLLRLANYYVASSQMPLKKYRVFGYPTHLTVDVTNICNLRCPLCPTGVGAPGRRKGMMPLATFRKLIDDMGSYLISIDLFNWGEPLLNKDIYEMIAYAHERDIVTSVSTNFHHFSEGSAEKLIASGLDVLILSIDGASQGSYEKYRIGGDFRKVIENVSLLVGKRKELGCLHPHICWQFLVMKHNEHEVEAARKMAAELGVDQITIDPAYLPVDTREDVPHMEIGIVAEKRGRQAEGRMNPAAEVVKTDSGRDDLKRKVNCSWLWTQTTVNWDGGVSPCCAIYDPSEDFGNISGTPLNEVWNNKKYRESRRFSSKGEIGDTLTVCMRCPLAMHD